MTFSNLCEPSLPLFKEWKILKIKDIVDMQNCLLVHSFLKGKLPKSFENFFQKCSNIHINPTRLSSSECSYLPLSKSVTYGIKSIVNHWINSWNTLTGNLYKPPTHPITTVKKILCNNFIANYWFDIGTMLLIRFISNKWSYKIHLSLLPLPSPTYSISVVFFSQIINFSTVNYNYNYSKSRNAFEYNT